MPFVLFGLSLSLSACDVEIDAEMQETITVYRNETWEADMAIMLDRELVEQIAEDEGYSFEPDGGLVEEYISEADLFEDVDISWESHTSESGDVTYDVHMRGKGLDALRYSVFDETAHLEAVEIDGNKRFVLSHTVGFPEAMLRSYTVTLIGGRIISSNGQVIDDSAVRWVNPSGRMEATFTGKSRFGIVQAYGILAAIAGFALLVIMAIAGIVYYVKIRQPDESQSTQR